MEVAMDWGKKYFKCLNRLNRIIFIVAIIFICLLILFFSNLAGILFLAKKWYSSMGILALVIVLVAMSKETFQEIKINSWKKMILFGLFFLMLFIFLWMVNYPSMQLAKMSASFFIK